MSEEHDLAIGRPGLTAALARFVAGSSHIPCPPDVQAAATRAFIDTVGVILAGRGESAVRITNACCAEGAEAVSLATGRRLAARDAALIDGVAGHVLDYDDVALHGHASVVLIPAILAEAQRLSVPGSEALKAYAIGYEVWCEVARREADSYHLGAWHPTSMLGVIAATASIAALNRLDAARTQHALAIAASLASGVIASFGSDAKPLQVGRAAASAVDAVRLAAAGMTGAPDALESRSGLLTALSPKGHVDLVSPLRFQEEGWQLARRGISVKRYPVCYATHRAVDGVIALLNDAAPSAIARVTVTMGRAPARTVDNARPTSALEAKFSLQHNVAAALADGALGFTQLCDAYVRRDDIAALYGLTRIEISDEPCPDQPGMALHDRVVVEMRDGRRLDSGDIRYPRGHARLPLSDAELDAKFRDCAAHGSREDADRLLASLHAIDRALDLDQVMAHGI